MKDLPGFKVVSKLIYKLKYCLSNLLRVVIRFQVKKSMKENKDNSSLHRVLHARQLGLKLIANVTYGYTSANFSGRMPCIEVNFASLRTCNFVRFYLSDSLNELLSSGW